MKYKIISKTIFFPEKGILAIGDLHLGYEEMLRKQGLAVPFNQLDRTKEELTEIFSKIKKQGYELKKIVLLGDIKHHFNFDVQEKFEVRKFIVFLKKYVREGNIILIKGNHEKFELDKMTYLDYYLEDGLAFTHGDKMYKELLKKDIKVLVMGHVHPAINLKDPEGVKKEKYKCFLIGNFKKKELIIVPSFFPLVIGSEVDEMREGGEFSPIVSKKQMKNFKTFVVGKDRIYEFGKYKEI